MHAVISQPHSEFFYESATRNGVSARNFLRTYNQRKVKGTGFFPLTFLDTSFCRSRRETDEGDGILHNFFESKKVRWVILKLLSEECLAQGTSALQKDGLKGKIAVIAPYRAQVESIRNVVTPELMRRMEIVVDTVDAMQGSEKDIVIFSCTRSNERGAVGFLTNKRRLNVAMSRARNLLVIIGDREHLFPVTSFRFFISWCRDGRDGAGMMTVPPTRGDELAQPVTRGGSMNLYRRKSGYDLRSQKAPSWLDRDSGQKK